MCTLVMSSYLQYVIVFMSLYDDNKSRLTVPSLIHVATEFLDDKI